MPPKAFYPHNPMKGASEHFHFLSSLRAPTTTWRATSTSAAWATCATASLPAFPPSACPRCRCVVSAPARATLPGSPSRAWTHDDGPVHPPGGLPAGDALRLMQSGTAFEVEGHRHKKNSKKARCPSTPFFGYRWQRHKK